MGSGRSWVKTWSQLESGFSLIQGKLWSMSRSRFKAEGVGLCTPMSVIQTELGARGMEWLLLGQ